MTYSNCALYEPLLYLFNRIPRMNKCTIILIKGRMSSIKHLALRALSLLSLHPTQTASSITNITVIPEVRTLCREFPDTYTSPFGSGLNQPPYPYILPANRPVPVYCYRNVAFRSNNTIYSAVWLMVAEKNCWIKEWEIKSNDTWDLTTVLPVCTSETLRETAGFTFRDGDENSMCYGCSSLGCESRKLEGEGFRGYCFMYGNTLKGDK